MYRLLWVISRDPLWATGPRDGLEPRSLNLRVHIAT
jgi:hypothetical protein